MEPGHFTKQEILSQPDAWKAALTVIKQQQKALQGIFHSEPYSQVIFTGCGSTYYLALAAASLTRELTGLPARGLPASELWLYPQNSYTTGKTLLVAVSRSGETTETIRACDAFLKNRRGTLVTLSCYEEMPLAKMGTLNLVLPSGQEQSVAQTRAFSSLYLGTVALACLWGGHSGLFDSLGQLPEAGQRLLGDSEDLAVRLGQDAEIDRFYWLGSGPRYGLGCELSLKMKEMSLTHSEPFHFLEFRHGPKSMITPSALVVGLRSSLNSGQEAAVLQDVKAGGGRVLVLGEEDADICFHSKLEEAVRNILYLPVGQRIAFERSLSKGLNPDQPKNLTTVVKLPSSG